MKVLTMSEAKSQIKEGRFECMMDLKVGIVAIRTHKNKYKYIQVEEDPNFKMVPINKLLLIYSGGEEIDDYMIKECFGMSDDVFNEASTSDEEVELSWIYERWAYEYTFDFRGVTYDFQANEIFI